MDLADGFEVSGLSVRLDLVNRNKSAGKTPQNAAGDRVHRRGSRTTVPFSPILHWVHLGTYGALGKEGFNSTDNFRANDSKED
jgi:hypothetical protein